MVMICQQCGDKGFENAFIHCVKCLGFVIHRYCLNVIPKTFDEIVHWVCDDCKQKFSNQSAFPSHNSLHISDQDNTSSVNNEEIHSRGNLKTNRDTASLVDGADSVHCQETAVEQEQTHIPLADSRTKVKLRKRKKRHTACLVDETEEDSGSKVIIESEIEHVELADSPIKLDSKRKKIENIDCLLSGTEEISCSEAIGEPYPLKQDVPLAELCARAKSEKEKKKKKEKEKQMCSNSSLAGAEEENSHGELTKEPDCQVIPLANSPVKVKLKETTNEDDTDLTDLKEKMMKNNTTCYVSETRDEGLKRSPSNSCHEACTKMDGVADSTDNKKCRFDIPLQLVKADNKKLDSVNHDKLVSGKLELDKTTKDHKCKAFKAELCARAKSEKEKKKKKEKEKQMCSNSSLAGADEENSHGELRKEPDCQVIPLANSPVKVKLKETTNEEDTGLTDLKEKMMKNNTTCYVSETRDEGLKRSPSNSCHEACTKMDGVADSTDNKKCRFDIPLQLVKADNKKLDSVNHDKLVSGKLELDKTTKDHKCKAFKAELCARAKSEKEKKKKKEKEKQMCSNSSLAGAEEENSHGELTKEPDCQVIPLANSPVKVKLKETTNEEDTGLTDLKEKMMKNNTTCYVSETRDEGLKRSPSNSCHEACTKMDGVANSTDNKKCRFDIPLQLVKADNKKLDSVNHDKLVSGKLELDKTTKDHKCKAFKAEDVALINEKEQPMINKEIEPHNAGSQFAKCVNNSQQDVYVHAQPVIDPIWTGGFDIANKDYETYAVGHVSSKVCGKVYEEAHSLPSSLSLEMLPKSDLWPKSFLENKPSDDNIALYFFPAGPKHERIFDLLVDDMMNEELAMRAVVTNAELLIFTSAELPPSFWRFQGKYYLWGVFKAKRVNPSPPANNHLQNSKGSNRSDPNSSKNIESGKRNLQDTKGSDPNSSKKMESGKRNVQESKRSERSDPRSTISNKVESGKRNLQHSKGGSDKSSQHTNSSSGKWKDIPLDKNFGGRKEFSKSFKH